VCLSIFFESFIMKSVIVLGSGILGVTSAYYLSKAGCQVTVIDRQQEAASETSYANGGQISVSHAEPWANPSAPLKVLQWLGKEDAPLLFRIRADKRQWLWGMQFLRECTPGKTQYNIRQIVNLGTYSRDTLQALRAETGVHYKELTKGILHFYTSEKEFQSCLGPSAQMRELGCDRQVVSADRAVELEPALAHIRSQIAGATYTAEDESGDAKLFTRSLVELCKAQGVTFLMGHNITALNAVGGEIDHVEVTNNEGRFSTLKADAYVLAMGSYSPMLAAQVGVNLNIYPAKGYSATVKVLDSSKAPSVSLTDDEFKLVFSRYEDSLRIAGTAELNGYDRNLNMVRCNAITRRVEQLFPGATDTANAQFWTGLRPATPSNLPYIGKSKVGKLYLNTGHGTLGWTHGCGSGKAIADIIMGKKPSVDFAFTGV
jgi:D-amino-acid dehydrogenase